MECESEVMLGQKMFLLTKMLLPLPHLLQLHQLLTFSYFSISKLLPFPTTYNNFPSIPNVTAMVAHRHN